MGESQMPSNFLQLSSLICERDLQGFVSGSVSDKLRYIFNRIVHRFSCENTLVNKTHDRKGTSKFPLTFLYSFMRTNRVGLSHNKNILFTASGACQTSNLANI